MVSKFCLISGDEIGGAAGVHIEVLFPNFSSYLIILSLCYEYERLN